MTPPDCKWPLLVSLWPGSHLPDAGERYLNSGPLDEHLHTKIASPRPATSSDSTFPAG